jgi:hypothetical protein
MPPEPSPVRADAKFNPDANVVIRKVSGLTPGTAAPAVTGAPESEKTPRREKTRNRMIVRITASLPSAGSLLSGAGLEGLQTIAGTMYGSR